MANLQPFRALRPDPARASEVAAVPYDVVSVEEAAALARGNPVSFLRVSRPELELPLGTPADSEPVRKLAHANFERLKREVPFLMEREPALYIYELKRGGHVQTGVAGCFSVDEYDRGLIRKHEKTRPDKEDDRLRHLLELRAQTGLVYLAYRDQAEVDREVARWTREQPLYRVVAPDGVEHTIWKVAAPERLRATFAAVPTLYIADGHHRAAAASRARAKRVKAGTALAAGPSDDGMLAVAFPASQLRILPYHRLVKDLNGLSPADFLRKLEVRFETLRPGTPEPARGELAMYLRGEPRWIGLRPRVPRRGTDPAANLDVSLLQDEVLAPILGISDPRTSPRIDFVGGIRGTSELERAVNEERAVVAFALHPTTMDDLFRISDAGGIMPPKSTWFEPKLRDGFLIHELI